MKADAQPHGDRARDVRRRHGRGLHLEAAARHRRLHDVRPLHVGVPGPRHRQAARPPRDRAQDRRGHGPHRHARRCRRPSASTPRSPCRRRLAVRAHHPRGGVGLHVVQGVRRDLPGQHRDPRQDPRHAALPVADGVELPDRAGHRLPLDGELGQPVGPVPGRAGRLGRRSSTASPIVDARRRLRPRVPLLGRLRRQLRRQEPEGHRGHGQADAAGRHRLRHPRPVRELHRRPRPPLGQRVHLPDARHAEHRDARRHGREEDRHAVPALLQHAAERVPAARRQLRGRAPQPVPRVADRRGPARHERRPPRRAGRLPRLLLPRPPQRHLPVAPQGDRQPRRHRDRRGRPQRHQGHVLRRRRRPHVDGGDDRARRSTTSAARSSSPPAPAASPSPARSATS